VALGTRRRSKGRKVAIAAVLLWHAVRRSMLKRILLWLAIVFTVFYILTAPADAANAVQGAWNALLSAGRAFLTFIDALFA
jgi:hypothetical protein